MASSYPCLSDRSNENPSVGVPASGGGRGGPQHGADLTRSVTRVTKLRSTSIDWISLSFPEGKKGQLVAYLNSLFGKPERKGHGLHSYRDMYEWQPFVLFCWNGKGDSAGTCWLQVSGEACSYLATMMYSFLVKLHSFEPKKVGRFDVAIDFEGKDGESLGILDAARDAAIKKQVAKVHTKKKKGSKRQGPLAYIEDGEGGRTQYFGSNSTAKTRIYDKGAETGQCEPKQWERWETQFAGQRADILFLLVVAAGPDAYLKVARAHAIGAVEFREVAKSNRAMSRRPLLRWYKDLCTWLGKQRMKLPKREFPALDRFQHWIQKQVLPMSMAVAAAAGIGVGEFFDRLSGDVVPSQGARAEFLGKCMRDGPPVPPGIYA